MTQQSSPSRTALALFYVAPQKAELRSVDVGFVADLCPRGDVLIKSAWSGLSRGTEKLIYEGRVPRSEYARMRAPFQEGELPFPVKYGYCAVGIVEEGPEETIGRAVFALHPHQDVFAVPASAAVPVPDGVPLKRAILAANMETALNAVWDSGAGPCDRVLVVGAGTVGLLIANLLGRIPGVELFVADINQARRELARDFGARFLHPGETAGLEADIAFHTSATAAGLQTCFDACGFEGRVIEVSWYGDRETPVGLGGAFHAKRLGIVSSQVGAVSPSRRPRWPHRRRQEAALSLLRDPRLDALITHEVAFSGLPQALPELLRDGADVLTAAVRYD